MTEPIDPPYYPIIYVRGYAGSEQAVEETVATPYMGFNLGATKVRQRWTGDVERVIFESPLVRLMKEHGYLDTYLGGAETHLTGRISARSVIIYRYYDQTSPSFEEDPERPDIPEYAEGLDRLIGQVRDAVCGKAGAETRAAREAFRVVLVAHSMGGLICRCFLQNPEMGRPENRAAVDKVFTYATPHNGIDLRVLGNVPGFFSRNNANNFNRKKMADYLKLPPDAKRVDGLNRTFDPDRFFSLVGTNSADYAVAAGWSRRMVGPMSDGLVRIENATVHGSPRAFVHRSHSGHYGIVNSEEGYQNLSRFLFGDVRVDGVLEVDEVTLPPEVARRKREGKKIRASYHFETVVRPRGARYDLHRRVTAEGSAVFRDYAELIEEKRHPHLFSTFLSASARTKAGSGPLVFSIDVRVLVPEYEIDGFLFLDDHIEGAYLFSETLTVAASVPANAGEAWRVRWGLDSRTPGRASRDAERLPNADGSDTLRFAIPLESTTRPGMKGRLVLHARTWNTR